MVKIRPLHWLPTRKMRQVEVDARVARGARWLDQKRPGWAHEVKISTLDLKEATDCVLGQIASQVDVYDPEPDANRPGIFDDFIISHESDPCVLRLLNLRKGLDADFLAAHGFSRDRDDTDMLWGRLNVAWKAAIRERRAQQLLGSE